MLMVSNRAGSLVKTVKTIVAARLLVSWDSL
jgi:hypothetical protein